MMYQCLQCSTTGESGAIVEFDSRADWMAHMKAHKAGTKLPMPSKKVPPPAPVQKEVEKAQPAPPPRVPLPIELKYVYIGECPVCMRAVDTLDITLDEGLTMVAYCTSCKKQCTTKKVVPISSQDTKKE